MSTAFDIWFAGFLYSLGFWKGRGDPWWEGLLASALWPMILVVGIVQAFFKRPTAN
jgi:hypothetical protein